jgi:hypothetical protein
VARSVLTNIVGATVDKLGEQVAFVAGPGHDPLAYRAIETAEILLHLAEIREQLAGSRRELLIAVTQRGATENS